MTKKKTSTSPKKAKSVKPDLATAYHTLGVATEQLLRLREEPEPEGWGVQAREHELDEAILVARQLDARLCVAECQRKGKSDLASLRMERVHWYEEGERRRQAWDKAVAEEELYTRERAVGIDHQSNASREHYGAQLKQVLGDKEDEGDTFGLYR